MGFNRLSILFFWRKSPFMGHFATFYGIFRHLWVILTHFPLHVCHFDPLMSYVTTPMRPFCILLPQMQVSQVSRLQCVILTHLCHMSYVTGGVCACTQVTHVICHRQSHPHILHLGHVLGLFCPFCAIYACYSPLHPVTYIGQYLGHMKYDTGCYGV